ncbi:hypothetical protein [Achromobacter marplatensis]|uniref:hypothetical protein n=1 Tax=Achromobacter marplatensis TaxID=470868 RepID=UPI0039F72931
MHSPQPVLTSAPVGNVRIVYLAPQSAVGPMAEPRVAANDDILPPPQPLASPAGEAGPIPLMQVPLAIALAVMLWAMGALVLLTLALAYRLLA